MDLFRLGACENYDKICGEVLFTTKGRLAFYCTSCGKYRSYQSFLAHLLGECFQSIDDDLKGCVTKESLTASFPISYVNSNDFMTVKSGEIFLADPLAQNKSIVKSEIDDSDELINEFMPSEDWNQDSNECSDLEQLGDGCKHQNVRVKSELETPYSPHTTSGKEILRCHICELESFKTANQLSTHLKHHAKGDKKISLSSEAMTLSRPQRNQFEKLNSSRKKMRSSQTHKNLRRKKKLSDCNQFINNIYKENEEPDAWHTFKTKQLDINEMSATSQKEQNENQSKSSDAQSEGTHTYEGITFDDMLNFGDVGENIDENSKDCLKVERSKRKTKNKELEIALENLKEIKQKEPTYEDSEANLIGKKGSNQLTQEHTNEPTSDAAGLNSAEGSRQRKTKTIMEEVPVAVRNVSIHQPYLSKPSASEEKKFKCPICELAFKDKHNMKMHLRRHTGNRPYSCPDCEKKFFTSTEVRLHSRVHIKLPLNFLCNECGSGYDSNYKLKKHQKRHTNQRDYVCDLCPKAFFDSDSLKKHKRTVHYGEKRFSCKICAATFKRRHGLAGHMKQHENKRAFKCQLCEAAYNVKPALYAHMKSKHGSITNAQSLESYE